MTAPLVITHGPLNWDKALNLAEGIRNLEGQELAKMARVMDAVGTETVTFLRSLTNEVQPPALHSIQGPGMRHAHPGHWADITGILAGGYGYRVVPGPNAVTLELTNDVEYAAQLEKMSFYFVLSGVADPGGPVDKILTRLVAILAPGYVVVPV